MNDTLQFYDAHPAVNDRIHDLYTTAAELRASRAAGRPHSGLVTRVRTSVGRRIVSFGSTLAGQHA